MIVLSRKSRESVVIGGHNPVDRMLKVTVLEIDGGKVRLGFEVQDDVPIHPWEVWQRICAGEPPPTAMDGPIGPFAAGLREVKGSLKG